MKIVVLCLGIFFSVQVIRPSYKVARKLAQERFEDSKLAIPERYKHLGVEKFVDMVLFGFHQDIEHAQNDLPEGGDLDHAQRVKLKNRLDTSALVVTTLHMRKIFGTVHGCESKYIDFCRDFQSLENDFWDATDPDAHSDSVAQKVLDAFPAESNDRLLLEYSVTFRTHDVSGKVIKSVTGVEMRLQ